MSPHVIDVDLSKTVKVISKMLQLFVFFIIIERQYGYSIADVKGETQCVVVYDEHVFDGTIFYDS